MALGLAAALYYVSREFLRADATVLVAIYFILLELALVTALGAFFLVLFKPHAFHAVHTGNLCCRYFLQRHSRDRHVNPTVPQCRPPLASSSYLLPNFHNFNMMAAASHGDAIPFSLIWQNTAYAALYVALLLIAASAVFSGRNLK